MREVDHLHDAKNQGQTGRHQKQGHTELEAVEDLFDNQEHENTSRAQLRGGESQARSSGKENTPACKNVPITRIKLTLPATAYFILQSST